MDWYFRKPLRHKALRVRKRSRPLIKVTIYRLLNSALVLLYCLVKWFRQDDGLTVANVDLIYGLPVALGSVLVHP